MKIDNMKVGNLKTGVHTMRTVILLFALAAALPALAQTEDFSFDWNGQSDRHLRVNLLNGSVTVEGYEGDQVLISVSSQSLADGDDAEDDDPEAGGMRLLPNGGQNLVVRQDGGEIIIRAGTMDDAAGIVVRLPRDARLTVNSAQDGAIKVNNVDGEMQVQSSSGPVEVLGIRNTAIIHAHADDLKASLAVSELPGPLVFTSWAGDVDVTMPSTLRADLRWRTNFGDVRTDLDVQNIATVTVREEETPDGLRIEGFTTGQLNGGGPEISITAYTGDITLRRAD